MAKKKKESEEAQLNPESYESLLMDRWEIEKRINALALLMQYVINRCLVSNRDVEDALAVRFQKGTEEDWYPKNGFTVKEFREGKRHVKNAEAQVIRDYLLEVLERAQQVVRLDYDFIKPILVEAGLGGLIGGANTYDYSALDVAILTEMGMEKDSAEHRYKTEFDKYKRLFDLVGGIWLMVRKSLSSDKAYVLSLLNIKPQYYISTKDDQVSHIKTFALHFSYRSREDPTDDRTTHAFFGRVIPEAPGFVNLVGATEREHTPVFMSLTFPGQTHHSHEIHGLIMSVDGGSATFASPIAGVYVSDVAFPETDNWKLEALKAPVRSSKLYEDGIDQDKLLQNAAVHKNRCAIWSDVLIEGTLEELEQLVTEKLNEHRVPETSITHVISDLKRRVHLLDTKMTASGAAGYFKARP